MRSSAIVSSTSAGAAIRRAASLGCSGKAGWGPTRPAARSSAATSRGTAKCAAWSPCRWPISRLPSRKDSSPRSPSTAVTPGHEVTSAMICSLAVGMVRTLRRDPARLPGVIGPTTCALGAQAGERQVVEVDLEAERVQGDGAQPPDDRGVERLAPAAPLALRGSSQGCGGRPAGGAPDAVGMADDARGLERAQVAVDGGDVAGPGAGELLGRARRAGSVQALQQPSPRRGEADAAGAQGADRG